MEKMTRKTPWVCMRDAWDREDWMILDFFRVTISKVRMILQREGVLATQTDAHDYTKHERSMRTQHSQSGAPSRTCSHTGVAALPQGMSCSVPLAAKHS